MSKVPAPKRTPAISVAIEIAGGDHAENDTLVMTPAFGAPIRITAGMLSFEVLRYATMHGLKQKLVDAAAISRNPDTGRSATVSEKLAAVDEVLQRLLAGEWNKRREGNGGSGGLLFSALCRLYPAKAPEALREFLDGKTDAEKAALRKNPKVAAIIEEIRAERAGDEGVDSDELLGELDGDTDDTDDTDE